MKTMSTYCLERGGGKSTNNAKSDGWREIWRFANNKLSFPLHQGFGGGLKKRNLLELAAPKIG